MKHIKKISTIGIILIVVLTKYTYASFNVQSITTEISDRWLYIIKHTTYRTYSSVYIISIFSNSNINSFKQTK